MTNKEKLKHCSSVAVLNFAACHCVSYYSTATMVLTCDGWLLKAVTNDALTVARLALLEPRRPLASSPSAKLPGMSSRPRSNTAPFLLIIRSARRQKRTSAWILSFIIRCSGAQLFFSLPDLLSNSAAALLSRSENKHLLTQITSPP